MMNLIKREVKRNLLIMTSKNGFVPYSSDLESFKKISYYNIATKVKSEIQNLKRLFNSIVGKPRLLASSIDFGKLKHDFLFWGSEAIIDGVIANWWTHKIIGLEFSIGMIIAHGFLIKQTLDLYQRIKYNGSNNSIFKENKQL